VALFHRRPVALVLSAAGRASSTGFPGKVDEVVKAWQFTNTHEPLVLNEVPEPAAGPGTVVVDVKASGLCHTDVGVLEDEGWLPALIRLPITMGHEVAGVISELGEGVTGWSVGDRVGLCPTTSVGAPGFMYDGGFGSRCSSVRRRWCESRRTCPWPSARPAPTPA